MKYLQELVGVAVSSAAERILVPSSAAKVLVAAWLLRIAAEGSNSASFAAESAGSFGSAVSIQYRFCII